jgi:hypothetical protein
MARRLWLAVTSVPLAVAVNDQVFGITVIDSNNGGAGMTFLGGDATPNRAIVLSRKQLTFKLLPVKPGDVVVTKYEYSLLYCANELYVPSLEADVRLIRLEVKR